MKDNRFVLTIYTVIFITAMSMATMIIRSAFNLKMTNQVVLDAGLHLMVHSLFALLILHFFKTYLEKEVE